MQNRCPADRKSFLSNYGNKEAFVNWLSTNLSEAGFNVINCPADADTTIVSSGLAEGAVHLQKKL